MHRLGQPDTFLTFQHPMEVFKAFRGREPSVDALLRHTGLEAAAAEAEAAAAAQ